MRILFCQSVHIIITIGLGKDTGRCNREIFAIAFDDGGVREFLVRLKAIAIYDDGFWSYLQLIQGSMHGKDGGIKDIDFIYLFWRDDTYCPCNSITLDNLTQLFTPFVRQLLGIIQFFVLIILRKDDSSGIDTASQTTSTSLIATSLNLSFVIMTRQHNYELSKHLTHTLNACNEGVNLLFRIIQGEGGADSTLNTQAVHQRLCTMMTCADSNAQSIQECS